MRTTLLGSLLDALRRNRSRGFEDVRLFEYGAVYLPRRATTTPTGNPWYPVRDPALPSERAHLGALLTGRVRPRELGRRRAAAPSTSSPPRRVLEALLRALRVDWCVEPGARAVPAPAPRRPRARRRRRRPAGSASCTRRSRPRGTSTAPPASSSTSARSPRPPRPSRATRTSRRSPPSARTSPSSSPTTCPPRACSRSSAAAGGALLRGAEVFDVYRGAQVGEGRASLAIRLEFRAPDRTLTDEEVAQRREKIVAALREQVGGELRG